MLNDSDSTTRFAPTSSEFARNEMLKNLTMTANQKPILAVDRGSLIQFALTTFPLLIVLIYFLYEASTRSNKPVYNLGDDYTYDEWQSAFDETGDLLRLMDMLAVFMVLLLCWAAFAVYVIYFVPKRRHLIGRYLSEGRSCVGDVHFDRSSRSCGRFNDYGYAVYGHPGKTDGSVVRKRVRVYQGYTRENLTILTLPEKPFSGQSKIDLEIDLLAATEDRDTKNTYIAWIAVFWVAFTLLAPIYLLRQMKIVNDPDDSYSKAIKVYLVVVGLTIPFALGVNWARFLSYRSWMLNRGVLVGSMEEAKNPQGDLVKTPSEDGSDFVPYSIMNEDECSYLGHIPDHKATTEQRAWVQV